jgi:hypothetical protein
MVLEMADSSSLVRHIPLSPNQILTNYRLGRRLM